MIDIPYAEEMNYWQSSRVSPETNIDRTVEMIEAEGGQIFSRAFGSQMGREAYLIEFVLQGERFRVAWPVLPTKTGKQSAARIQASRLIYHDVKHKLIMMKLKGARTAFFEYLLLPDGCSITEKASPELLRLLPGLLKNNMPQLQEQEGEVLDGG